MAERGTIAELQLAIDDAAPGKLETVHKDIADELPLAFFKDILHVHDVGGFRRRGGPLKTRRRKPGIEIKIQDRFAIRCYEGFTVRLPTGNIDQALQIFGREGPRTQDVKIADAHLGAFLHLNGNHQLVFAIVTVLLQSSHDHRLQETIGLVQSANRGQIALKQPRAEPTVALGPAGGFDLHALQKNSVLEIGIAFQPDITQALARSEVDAIIEHDAVIAARFPLRLDARIEVTLGFEIAREIPGPLVHEVFIQHAFFVYGNEPPDLRTADRCAGYGNQNLAACFNVELKIDAIGIGMKLLVFQEQASRQVVIILIILADAG